MSPLRFRPLLKRIRWGGRRLGSMLGKPIGPGDDYAESWEIVDRAADQSIVEGGEYAGWTLARLIAERGAELLGRDAGLPRFPLLIKYLDAQDRLSVQVHPNDDQARRHDPLELGKTEAWVIIAAEPESPIYAGLKKGVDHSALADALARDRLEDCLHSFPVKAGDCVFVPAGTVHAIGAGVLLAEIQQSSDITYRLHDWGWLGSDKKPRPLHVPQALGCIDFAQGPVAPVVPRIVQDGIHRVETLVECPYFILRRHVSAAPFSVGAGDQCRVLMLLSGEGRLVGEGGAEEPLQAGTTLLAPPAASAWLFEPQGAATLLEVALP